MDIAREGAAKLLANLREHLKGNFVDMSALSVDHGVICGSDEQLEELALANEGLLESYAEGNPITVEDVADAIRRREVFPCVFGSALKNEGVEEFLQVLDGFIQAETVCYSTLVL